MDPVETALSLSNNFQISLGDCAVYSSIVKRQSQMLSLSYPFFSNANFVHFRNRFLLCLKIIDPQSVESFHHTHQRLFESIVRNDIGDFERSAMK